MERIPPISLKVILAAFRSHEEKRTVDVRDEDW